MASQRDLLLGLLVIMAWAGNAVVIKFITLEVTPFIGLALRMLIATALFIPFLKPLPREKFWHMAQVTFLMSVLHWGSLIWAIERLDASMAAIIMQTQVIFAVLVGRFMFTEKFGWRTGAGIAVGITGVIILVGLPQNPPSITGVLGMIFSMITIVLAYARMKTLEGISSINYVAHLHVLGLIPIALLAFIFEAPLDVEWRAINPITMGATLLYQILIVSAAHMLWQRLMTRNAMSGLPNLTLLLPVLGVTFAWIFLGESITPAMTIGGLITTAGVGVVMIRKQKKQVRT